MDYKRILAIIALPFAFLLAVPSIIAGIIIGILLFVFYPEEFKAIWKRR